MQHVKLFPIMVKFIFFFYQREFKLLESVGLHTIIVGIALAFKQEVLVSNFDSVIKNRHCSWMWGFILPLESKVEVTEMGVKAKKIL